MAENEVSPKNYMPGGMPDYAPGYPPGYMSDEHMCVRGVVRIDNLFLVIIESMRDRRFVIARISESEFRFLRRIGIPEIIISM